MTKSTSPMLAIPVNQGDHTPGLMDASVIVVNYRETINELANN